MDVCLAASVDEYFHEVVTSALSAVDLEVSEPASWYLVGLLGEMTRARITDEALGIKLAQSANDNDPVERVKTLKQVGDTSLYVAGFFAESLNRSLVDIDYYVGIGQNAYSQLARSLGTGGQKSLTDIYAELADKFPRFVDVIAEVRKRSDFATPDIGKLYEMWLRTRDEWIERKLRALGVLVDVDHKVIQ